MDQNQTVDNDLQKAIDDITNKTNVDPVFSDPVAAPSSVPEGDTGELGEPVGPFPEPPKINLMPPVPEPATPVDPTSISESMQPPMPLPEQPTTETPPAPAVDTPKSESLSTSEVKKAALRDLVPLLDKISIDASQKFNLYRDIFDDLKDYTVLEPAYRAAKDIPDETERAEALLYLVKSIDEM